MKFDQLLMNDIEKSCCDVLVDNFKKVVYELNFEDEMDCNIINGGNDEGYLWIGIIFNNSWELTIWSHDVYSMMISDRDFSNAVYRTNYKELLKFMEKNGIRKKQCEYKDAEIYILDF